MSDESVSWMLVSSSQTSIDTEALVDDVLSMRKIKDACDEQLDMLAGMIQDLRIHKCGEAADHFYSLGAHLSERMVARKSLPMLRGSTQVPRPMSEPTSAPVPA